MPDHDAKVYVLRKIADEVERRINDGWPMYDRVKASEDGLTDPYNLEITEFGASVAAELAMVCRSFRATAADIERRGATWREHVRADVRPGGSCVLVHRQYLAQVEEDRIRYREQMERIRAVLDEETKQTRSREQDGGVRCAVIESPFGGEHREGNERYGHQCIADSIARGEAPFASHLLYTTALDDDDPDQRRMGIMRGLEVGKRMDLTAVYTDLGITKGMRQGIKAAEDAGRPVEYRTIGGAE